MAKIGKYKQRASDKDEFIEVEFDVNVNKEGDFTTTLRVEDVEKIEILGVSLIGFTNGRRNGRRGFFCASSLDNLLKNIKHVLKECVSKELIDEKIVICYSLASCASFGLTLDGKVVPNMAWSLDGELNNDLYWQHGTVSTSATNKRPTGVQMYVKPFIKKTYRYQSGKTKVEMERCSEFGSSQFDDGENYNIKYLEQICSGKPPEDGTMRELDYTEERAEFFVKLFKGLCQLAHTIAKFEKPDDMLKLINSGRLLMPQSN